MAVLTETVDTHSVGLTAKKNLIMPNSTQQLTNIYDLADVIIIQGPHHDVFFVQLVLK
ncbi:hypothetical protein I4U23_031062 [Adineta vaga]|nr:hypothetical protein I4U23_031062 [Adineta vaga]